MSHSDTIPLHSSSQSDIDEIENLINAIVQSGPITVQPTCPTSPPRIPVSSSLFLQDNLPPPTTTASKMPPLPSSSAPPSVFSATVPGPTPCSRAQPNRTILRIMDSASVENRE
ncbi:unnamed protein product [Linum trigynum]|uniref:Uncharacterized protein n=1 Tax=Linum trigynum TaxID=586398 RepID=A0AAV2D8Y0_9ROSI